MTREEATIQSLLGHIKALEETIKALEQEPCEDAVSRAEVLKGYVTVAMPYGAAKKLVPVDYINNLPSVTPTRTRKWIPISERLPEDDGKYLVTMKGIISNFFYISTTSYAKDLHKVNKYDFKNGIGDGWYGYDGEYGYYKIDNVVAWMPLPTPYKAEMESEE